MKTRFYLKGLNCSLCAEKIRSEIEKDQNISSAAINFINKELVVETDLDAKTLFDEVNRIVISFEPNIKLEYIKEDNTKEFEENILPIILKLSISALFFIIAFIVELFFCKNNNFLPIVTAVLYGISYTLCSHEIILNCFKGFTKRNFFNENTLMFAASLGAVFLGEYAEAVAVMLLYNIGELLQSAAVNKSKRNISSLIKSKPETAELYTENGYITVKPESVQTGSLIRIKPGEKIPLDGLIISGSSSIDTCAITGESIPCDVEIGDAVKAGTINISGVLTIKTTGIFTESTIYKMLNYVEQAVEKKTKTENFITVFARYYTPIVVILAVLIMLIPSLFIGFISAEWIKKGLIFLVVSCPCAMVISIPLAFFAAIGKASSEGILIKGSNYIEALSKVGVILFDKTGTLTSGKFGVKKIISVRMSEKELLKFAAYCESGSNHPIALSVLEAYGEKVDLSTVSECTEIPGKGISAIVNGKKIICANRKYLIENGIECPEFNGFAAVYICIDNVYVGCILIADKIKENSAKTIAELNKNNIDTVMLTGDNKYAAESAAKEIGINKYYSELLPSDKQEITEKIMSEQKNRSKTVFVGDGINDAPVIATADIGIAMGAKGADSAIETADIVLMNDDPLQILFAYNLSKRTIKTVKINIVFALLVKLLVQILGIIGLANMWAAVFADVGVCLISIANSLRLIGLRNKGCLQEG